jgi:hypothetical protein
MNLRKLGLPGRNVSEPGLGCMGMSFVNIEFGPDDGAGWYSVRI